MLISEAKRLVGEKKFNKGVNRLLRTVIRQYCANTEILKDYQQAIWLKILSNIDKSKDGNFYNWIIKISINYCISEWRKQRHFRIVPIDFDIEDEVDDRLIMIEHIISEVDDLPEKYQAIIELRFFGITFTKISHYLGIPEGTVLQRYRDGIKRIRKKLVDKELIEERSSWNSRKIY